MEDNKDKLEPDFMYKSCTTRSDRDTYRICPSKLTKRELEDLYLTLLEENMEQKKTINIQQDRIKMLTTKVQRMFSAQKVHQADERKDNVTTKCKVDHHMQSILELQRKNEGMAERIRQLNIQLTSARQISKNHLCVPKCPRMSPAACLCLTDDTSKSVESQAHILASDTSKSVETQAHLASISQVCDDNKCRTLMDNDTSKSVETQAHLASISQVCDDNKCRTLMDNDTSKSVETQAHLASDTSKSVETQAHILASDTSNRCVETQAHLASISQVCDENKCRTLMDELKQKIVNLEEELARAHLEYSNRMSRLEIEVSQCRNQDTLARHESVPIEPRLQQPVASDRAYNELAELKNQLVIAKNKVAVLEILLETQMKTTVTSNLVHKTNENQLPSTQEQHPDESKEWENFLWDCTCTPVCSNSKPVHTMLRIFSRRLFSSAKNTNTEEIEIPNRMNDSTPRDANVRQDLAVDNKHTDEPLVTKYKVLPEVEHKDLSGYSKRESLPKDNEYKDKPVVEYNLPSDSRHRNASISKEYKKKLSAESKQTSGDNIHLDEFHSDKDKNNPSVKKDNLPNKNKIENPRSGNEYKTLPGIEYKDLPDEKIHLNMPKFQNYEDMVKVKREEKPDVNRPKYEHTTQNMTGPDLIDYNKSLNLDKYQNITEDHIKNDLAPQANTQALRGPSRSQNTDDKSQLIDGTSKLTDNVSQRSNDKSQRIVERNQSIDNKSRRTDDKKQLIDDKSQGQRTDDICPCTDERSKRIDDKRQRTDNKKQPIDKESQGQRTDDTSQRTDDKNEISRTSQTWLDGGGRDLHNIFADPNKQRVQTNKNVTVNMPVTNSSPASLAVQPQSERNYYINGYHKCECNAIKVRDTFNSNTNKNFVETMTTHDRNTLNLPNGDISQGLTGINKTLNVPTYNNRPDLTCTNEVQHRTKSCIKKDRDQTQPGANIIPNLIDTNESRGQTKADMTHKIPTLNSKNQTDLNKDKVQTQSTTKESINPSDTNERQDVIEEDMTTRQNLPFDKEVTNQTKSNIEKDKDLCQPGPIITQPKDNKEIREVVPYSKDPNTLAERLTDICEEQLQTIAELERQLDATKEPPRHSDKINLKLGKYFNTDEDDVNEMPFSKKSKSSKHELTTTKVADQNKTEDDLTSKLPQDNTRESKQKQESSTKPSTNGTKTVTPKNDRHNSLQIPGPISSTPVQTNNWKANILRRFSKDCKKQSSKKNIKNTEEASNNTDNEVDKTSIENEGTDFYVPERDTVIRTSQTTKKETKFVPKKIGSRHNGLNSPVTELIATQKPDTNVDVPVPTQRELKTYRSKDGSLCFKAKPVFDRSRCCQCVRLLHCEDYNIMGTQPEDKTQLTYSEGTQCMALQQLGYLVTASQNMPAETPKTPPGSPASIPKNQDTSTKSVSTASNVPVTKTNKAPDVLPASATTPIKIPAASSENKPTKTKTISTSTSVPANTEVVKEVQALPTDGTAVYNSSIAKTPPGSPASIPKNQDMSTKTVSTATNVPVTKTNKAPDVLPASATTPIKIPAASSENKPTKTKTISTSTSVPANTEDVKEVQALPTDAVPKSNNNDIPKGICTTETTKAQTVQLMEERLQALAAELTHYKEMLLSPQTPSVTKDQDVTSLNKETKSLLSELDEEQRQLRLKRGVAMHTIGDTYAPRCVFTLHVGTVVLSDEAVQSTRDRSLVLMWKFYNHNASITRMNAGRVMLFDFSSEYDIQITDEFLEYMKLEKMIIAICDFDDQSEPLVTCALPLREALLHTNRRADMSLELVAGPLMIHARSVNHAADDLDTGDEVGVIDLWCMLRADAKMLPIINKAIAHPSKSRLRKKSLEPRLMAPLIDSDSDKDSEGRIVNEVEPSHSQGKSDQSFQDMRDLHNKTLRRWGSSILMLPSREYNAISYNENPEYQDREEFYKNEKRTSVPKVRDSSVSTKSCERRESKSKSQPKKVPEKQQPKTSAHMATQVSNLSLTPQYDANQYQRRLTKAEEIAIDEGQGGILINEVIANIKTPEDMKIAMENAYRNSLHYVSRLPRNEDDIVSQAHSGGSSFHFIRSTSQQRNSDKAGSKTEAKASSSKTHEGDQDLQAALVLPGLPSDSVSIFRKYDNISKLYGSKSDIKKQVKINSNNRNDDKVQDEPQRDKPADDSSKEEQTVEITILWLALNEECEAMCDPRVQRVYVAYSFLGRSGADLETPFSLPKPKHHVDKCYFNFKKTFRVEEEDRTLLGHMARCRAASRVTTDFKDCIVFSVISEPPEDPLGLDTCEDIGYAFLYLGDLLAYSAGSSGYTEVIPVRSRGGYSVCGVLAVRFDGLDVLRHCAKLIANEYMPSIE